MMEKESELLELFNAGFGKRKIFENANLWRWWSQCPAGQLRSHLIYENDILVGHQGFQPMLLKMNDNVADAVLSNNSVIHPDYRRRGLFTKLNMSGLESENRPVIGMPNINSYDAFIKMGYKVAWLHFMEKREFRIGKYSSHVVDEFDDRVDDVIIKESQHSNFMAVRNHKWLNWRYVARPTDTYRLFVYYNGAKLLGYAVAKHYENKTHILDILANNPLAFDDLLLAVEEYARGTSLINLWVVGNCMYLQALERNGYKFTGDRQPLILHGADFPTPINWWVCLGDNDVY